MILEAHIVYCGAKYAVCRVSPCLPLKLDTAGCSMPAGGYHMISLYIFWLVVWNINFIFPSIGFLIIPIDELIFFRGVAQPPSSFCWISRCFNRLCWKGHVNDHPVVEIFYGAWRIEIPDGNEEVSTKLKRNRMDFSPRLAQVHTLGGFLSHRGTPGHHPFQIWMFHQINHPAIGSFGVPPF